MIVGPIITIGISTALLYLYLRWALIDPQNLSSQPGRLHALALAVALTIALIIAHGFALSAPSPVTSAIFWSILALILGPAIDPPERLTTEEEPSAVARWMHKLRVGKSGRLLKKGLLIFPLGWILDHVGVPTPWYFAMGFVALLFSVAKSAITISTVEGEKEKIRALLSDRTKLGQAKVRVANPLLHQSIILLSLKGSLSLAIWLALALPLVAHVPHLGIDWPAIIGLVLGIALSAIL